MLNAGVPLDRALAFAGWQARHHDLARAALQVCADVQGGAALAEALSRQPAVFSSLFVAMVAAGEESGNLDEAMERVAVHLDEMGELRAQIRASLVYPALMAITSGLGVVVLLLFVVPRFVSLIDETGGSLPLSTRLLIGGSHLLVGGWWALLLAAGALGLAARSWLGRPDNRKRWHAWRLTMPLAGELEFRYATARFTRVLGMLLQSGRPVLAALRTARAAIANLALGDALDRAVEAVNQGSRVHVALAGTLPPLATELLAVGEESGRLDELCLRIAESYDVEVRRTLRTLVAVIEPALILLFGIVVGFIALAMLQAIYGLNTTVL
jgi:type II secretory pathway component PulF